MNTMAIPEQSVPPPVVKQKELCPFFHRPFHDCRCVNMTSVDIPFVLKYCNGNQRECKIYLRYIFVE